MLKNMKIGTRLFMTFGVVVILASVLGFVGINATNTMANLSTDMYEHPLQVSAAVHDIRASVYAMHRSMKDVVLVETTEELTALTGLIDSSEKDMFEHFDFVEEYFLGDLGEVIAARTTFYEWKMVRDEVFLLRQGGELSRAAAITRGKGAQHVEEMNHKINILVDFADNMATKFNDDAIATRNELVTTMATLIGAMVLLSFIFATLVTRSVTVTIRQLTQAASRLAIPGVLNGYSYQVFSQFATHSGHR